MESDSKVEAKDKEDKDEVPEPEPELGPAFGIGGITRPKSLWAPLKSSQSLKVSGFRRRSTFCDMLSSAFSEDSRLNEEKAAELESRLKNLVSAFSTRVKKTKVEILRPPTPSSEESESDVSAASEANLNERLKVFSPVSSEEPSRQRSPTFSVISGTIFRGIRFSLRKALNLIRCDYVLDPQSNIYVIWLFIVSLVFIYNAWVIPLRAVFPYQTEKNLPTWIIADCVADLIYLIDIIAFKCHAKFVQHGFWVKESKETCKFYFFSRKFMIDALSLLPVDIIFTFLFTNTPWLRLPRLLKAATFWELFQILDNVLSSPHSARIARTLIHMLYMIHLNASAYYALSLWEGINTTGWTFDGEGNAYVRCFYFATKTATSIGKNPRPENEIEYMFMTCAWLSGVFVFAVLIGQIRDIVATATKAQTEYRQVCYTTDSYLHRFDVPAALQHRVKSWLSYTWEQQKTLDEGKILAQLPQKMQADIALHVHIDTLSKVKLFQNCEVAFLRDLVVKLRSVIYLPGDFVCRKGEVGKEMYIVKTGKVHVVGGPSGSDILVTLQEGAVFGEIALLAIGGINKRTADVRSAGFANLFVLSKGDLNEAIKDYPQAQESLRKKAKKLIREQSKKVKATAAAAQHLEATNSISGSLSSLEPDSDKIIIKSKPRQPKLISLLLKAVPRDSKTAMFMKFGSKADSIVSIYPAISSYPPSPFLPPGHLGDSMSFSSNSIDSDEFFPSLPEVQDLRSPQRTYERFEAPGERNLEMSLSESSERTMEEGIPEKTEMILTSSVPTVPFPLLVPNVTFEEVMDSEETGTTELEETKIEVPSPVPGPSHRKEEQNEVHQLGVDKREIAGELELVQVTSVLTATSKWKKKLSGFRRQFSVDDDEPQGGPPDE